MNSTIPQTCRCNKDEENKFEDLEFCPMCGQSLALPWQQDLKPGDYVIEVETNRGRVWAVVYLQVIKPTEGIPAGHVHLENLVEPYEPPLPIDGPLSESRGNITAKITAQEVEALKAADWPQDLNEVFAVIRRAAGKAV